LRSRRVGVSDAKAIASVMLAFRAFAGLIHVEGEMLEPHAKQGS
jgi:hypothetical protein